MRGARRSTAAPPMTLMRLERAVTAAVLMAAALAATRPAPPPVPAGPALSDLPPLLKQAREAQREDIVGWAGFRFRRQERVEELTDTGQVKSVRTFDYEIT